jgi:hypothetical protein
MVLTMISDGGDDSVNGIHSDDGTIVLVVIVIMVIVMVVLIIVVVMVHMTVTTIMVV